MLTKPVMFGKAVYAQEVSGACGEVQKWACGKNTYS